MCCSLTLSLPPIFCENCRFHSRVLWIVFILFLVSVGFMVRAIVRRNTKVVWLNNHHDLVCRCVCIYYYRIEWVGIYTIRNCSLSLSLQAPLHCEYIRSFADRKKNEQTMWIFVAFLSHQFLLLSSCASICVFYAVSLHNIYSINAKYMLLLSRHYSIFETTKILGHNNFMFNARYPFTFIAFS